jgi:peroxiredoxin
MYDKYRDKGLVVLGVNVPWDQEPLARRFVEVYKLGYPVGRDASGAIAKLYGVTATPTSVFIDRAGRIAETKQGELDEDGLTKRLEALVRKG